MLGAKVDNVHASVLWAVSCPVSVSSEEYIFYCLTVDTATALAYGGFGKNAQIFYMWVTSDPEVGILPVVNVHVHGRAHVGRGHR